MSKKIDWDLMHLVDKELRDAIGIESRDWKFNNSPAGMINVAIREKKSDVFYYLRDAVRYMLIAKSLELKDDEKSAAFIKKGIIGFATFINENENLKKFLDS